MKYEARWTFCTQDTMYMYMYLFFSSLRLDRHVNIWLLQDEVEVLVESVQQECQQLMRVVLLVARKLGGKFSHNRLGEGGGGGGKVVHICLGPSL